MYSFAPLLKSGSTISFFSASSPITAVCPIRLQRATTYLTEKGFNIIPGNLTGKSDYYRSGSIQERAEEFNALVRNPNIDCIMSTIGGTNTNSILPYIDYDALQRNPKVVVGYSDTTALLLAIYEKTKIETYYGPAFVASFGELPPYVEMTYQYFKDITFHNHEVKLLEIPDIWTEEYIPWETQDRPKSERINDVKFLGKGQISGRLIGGNLNTMTGIWGTPYMPEIKDGDILLLEDSLKGIDQIEKLFSLLLLSGVFEKIAAIILGKHEIFDHKGTERTPFEVLNEVLSGRHIPIVYDFDSCHTHPIITLPIGRTVSIDFDSKSVSVMGRE